MHCTSFILQSHYPNRRSADGRRAKFWKIGRRRPIIGRRRHRFWLNFWSADDFFVEATKLKVSLTDPPIFLGFVIGEASGDGRPMIGRQSADVLKKLHHDIDRMSPDHRASIGRRSPDGRSIRFYQRIVGRQTPISAVIRSMVARLSADHKMWFAIFFNACIHIKYENKSCINIILGLISLDLVHKYHLGFCCCWISN